MFVQTAKNPHGTRYVINNTLSTHRVLRSKHEAFVIVTY